MIKMKNNKGITLIALVVTISVMLILVTVSVNMIASDSGIVKKSKEAVIESEVSDVIDIFDEAQSEFLLKRARGYDKSNEEFFIDKGYLDNDANVQISKIISNAKTGKGDKDSLKDVYIYDSGVVKYYDKDGESFFITQIESEGSSLNIKFKNVYSSGITVLAIDENDDLWGFGKNYNNQIDDTDSRTILKAQRINLGKKVKQCSISNEGVAVLDMEGHILTWGKDSYGELGRGISNKTYNRPGMIMKEKKFKYISLSNDNLCVIDENGIIYGCGRNQNSQLGGSDTTNIPTLKLLDNSKSFKQVETGKNKYGKNLTIAVDSDDNAWLLGSSYVTGGENDPNFTSFKSIKSNVKKVQTTGQAIFILTNNGEIWSSGYEEYGALGLGYISTYTLTKINSQKIYTDIEAHDSVLLAKDAENKYWACGQGIYANLMTGFSGDEGKLTECIMINKMGNIKNALFVHQNAFWIDENGVLYSFGDNSYGQLGNGRMGDVDYNVSELTKVYGNNGNYVKIAAGEREGMAVDAAGDVYTWGLNVTGECGYDSGGLDVNEPRKIPNIKAKEISSGCSFSAIIDMDGNLYTFGTNQYSPTLGVGQDDTTLEYSSEPLIVMEGTKFVKVSCGQSNSYAIDVSGNLWAWGGNYYGELGDGTKTDRSRPVKIARGTRFKEIVAGTNNSFALDIDGYLWSTGYNRNGALGTGNNTSITTLTKVSDGRKYSKIAGFSDSLVAIDEQGNAYTCGSNSGGQLGQGTTVSKNVLTQVMNGTKFKACASAWDNIYLVDVSGNLWGAGRNGYFELLQEDDYGIYKEFVKMTNGLNIVGVASTGGNVLVLDYDGNVYGCGYNENTQCTRRIISDDQINVVRIKLDLEE